MPEKVRADRALLARGLYKSRAKAQEAIAAGLVLVDGVPLDKAGRLIDETAGIELLARERYVGRGGKKLEHALERFAIDLKGCVCADVGASTGGFTDCMLQHGACKVYAVDVGSDQLDATLRADPCVVVMEQTDIRKVPSEAFAEPIDLITVDVSFISLGLVLDAVARPLRPDGAAVVLIKPQFEAGRAGIGKRGVVRNRGVHVEVLRRFCEAAKAAGFTVGDMTWSPIRGGEGNIEYFAHLLREAGAKTKIEIEALVRAAWDALSG